MPKQREMNKNCIQCFVILEIKITDEDFDQSRNV